MESPQQKGKGESQSVKRADGPFACPPLDKPVGNGHPRVYLPLLKTGYAVCPYCSTQYSLKDF